MVAALMIAAYEDRDVTTVDIPGAYLQDLLSDNKHILMGLRSDFVDIICEVNSDYRNHVIHLWSRKKILYM